MKTRHIHALIAVGAVGGVLGFHHGVVSENGK